MYKVLTVVSVLTTVFAGCPFSLPLSFTLSCSFPLISHAGDSTHRLGRSLLPLVFLSAEAALTDGGSVSVRTTFEAVTTLSTRAAPVHMCQREKKG